MRSALNPPWRAISLVLATAVLLGAIPRSSSSPIPCLVASREDKDTIVPVDLGILGPLMPIHLSAPSLLGLLPPVSLWNINTDTRMTLQLYRKDGVLDEDAASSLDRLLADARRAGKPPIVTRMDRRLLQLLFRTAYHFQASEIELVSGYRRPWRYAEGFHGKARAIDFRLVGVDAREVAAYLRGLPRVGVGLYTHPRTRWVHLDVRDRSYHWIDGTPPGKRWGAARFPMNFHEMEARDAAYEEADDLPE